MTGPIDDGAGVAGGVAVATYSTGAPALMAALRGPLTAHRGCLVVGNENRHLLVVFRDTDIEWDGQTLTYEHRSYASGDDIDLMGGHLDLAGLHGLRLPTGWDSTTRAFVVAPGGDDRRDQIG